MSGGGGARRPWPPRLSRAGVPAPDVPRRPAGLPSHAASRSSLHQPAPPPALPRPVAELGLAAALLAHGGRSSCGARQAELAPVGARLERRWAELSPVAARLARGGGGVQSSRAAAEPSRRRAELAVAATGGARGGAPLARRRAESAVKPSRRRAELAPEAALLTRSGLSSRARRSLKGTTRETDGREVIWRVNLERLLVSYPF
ncbi:hypothetical protein PVAP13_9KG628201 [Panicum virgatum]|uniref:Uncharacterized protein n=1 Tax=Panicum virgatum TaxID=38727 RepID=A0A8T0NYU7_PANVG|nr:hypothetical protein PVAP13_9KG628201 [Panicum virgatum]